MVQRKEPQTKRSPVKLERQSSPQEKQDTRNNGGGGDLKKKMKLERSIRAADLESLQGSPAMKKKPKKRSPARGSPNYMKPTSSSDAKKEQLQVTPHSQTPTDKKRSPRNSKSSKNSNSCPSLGLKLVRSLSRQSSLKAIRPLIKKSVVVNRATCSSTLKDSKFPEALDLNPGGSEAEGTSVMRVCPYTYCSLNGHRHEPLPPLRCFMSERRKLLKTQKSMRLKGLSSLRAEVLGKDKAEIDTGQKATARVSSCLEIDLPMEDVPDDFFVEIYTASNPEEQITNENTQEGDEAGKSSADEIVEDSHDQSSEISNEDADVMMSLLEYVECGQEVDDGEKEMTPSLVPEDNGESVVVEGYPMGSLVKTDDGKEESEDKASTFDLNWEEEAGSPFHDNMTECSDADTKQRQEVYQESAEDGDAISPCDELSSEPITVKQSAVAEAGADLEQEEHHKVAEINGDMAPDDGDLEDNDTESHEGENFCRDDVSHQEPESLEDNDDEQNPFDGKEDVSDTSFPRSEEGVSEEAEENSEAGNNLLKVDNDDSCTLKSEGIEKQQNLLNGNNIKEAKKKNEVEETDSLPIVQPSDFCDTLKESDEEDHIENNTETVLECEDATEDAIISFDIQSCSSGDQSDESDVEESWESENEGQEEANAIEGSTAKSKARRRYTRKKITDEPDYIRAFNPRAPNFLDVEPDPEAEKVDLRHQTMDERKNSEEYLIDYALRRAVSKLAPARKKKVALLVEAFETVMPIPVYEKPLRHAASSFIHTRMQACS